jgi:hypothetical protein
MNMIKLILCVLACAVLAACPAPVAQKDFFECGANNTLVACPVGETPEAKTHGDCRAVGDGDTTLDDGVCS